MIVEWGTVAQIALSGFGVVFLVLGLLAAILGGASAIIRKLEQRSS